MRTILVIDDNPAVGTALDILFSLRGIKTLIAQNAKAGLNLLANHPIDLVVQDMNFRTDTTSGAEGVELFHAIRRSYADVPIILLTAWTHLETAIELVKAGAADYLAKPWDDNKLLTCVENLLKLSEATHEVSRLRSERMQRQQALRNLYDLRNLIFVSREMERLVELAMQVARADIPILITGKNGVGKECIAEIVQANSAVKSGAFVTVNCGALPSELMEAELFGADPGAYTSAPNRTREGRFELAHNGTLFLDEIGNLSLPGQMKLLRVLETGQFERLGSNRTRLVKVRIISATNADLSTLIREGRFREDLYYRLNVIELHVPDLAERVDDILPLADHFLGNQAKLDDKARTALITYTWPGNVRELKNAIQRAVLLCQDGVICVEDLGLGVGRRQKPISELTLDRSIIESALKQARGVISQAAVELGLSRQALYRRMEKLDIKNPHNDV